MEKDLTGSFDGHRWEILEAVMVVVVELP